MSSSTSSTVPELLPLIAPLGVVTRESRVERGEPWPGEELPRAVASRQREHATGRHLAREALAELGRPPAPLPRGESGMPVWPDGIVGSITHCVGFRGVVVSRDADVPGIGVDAEPHAALDAGVIRLVASVDEILHLADLARARADVHWDRLLFSAKEVVYKVWFPATRRWLGFEDAEVQLEPSGTWRADLLAEGPWRGIQGRWAVDDGLVLTMGWPAG